MSDIKTEIDELNTMRSELMAEAEREDNSDQSEGKNPAKTVDVDQGGIHELVKSKDSESDTETTEDNNDNADQSANDNVDEEKLDSIILDEDSDQEDSDDESNESENKQESKKMSRYQKEQARIAKAWKKNESEKEKLRAKEEELARREAEIEERASKSGNKTDGENDNKTPSSDDFLELAKYYEDHGEYEKAELAKEESDKARNREILNFQSQKKQSEQTEKQKQDSFWNNANKFIAQPENKELENAESNLGKAVKTVLSRDKRLYAQEDGFAIATHIAKGEIAMLSLADKEKVIAELKKENKRLNELTAIGDSSANSHNPNPKRKPMTLEQERAYFMDQARKEDSIAV